ncbi:MAG: ParB/RepB/Spo0J family partition protein [Epsilonproteobacteria bacterium]|nr:chromosome partitioning protein ParB [Campylobacterota bacterium]NPA56671.1 ParB/RepB/Spo0J family partition protein [Campylobacterota bacterium]
MAKRSLGRGLSDILGEVAQAYEREIPQNEIVEIDIDLIRKNPYQPRKYFDQQALEELAASIKSHGLLQPIVVIEDIDGFMLVAGERRLRASKMAGLKKIKAIIAKIDRSKYREFALIENIQREDLTPLELARSYKELIQEYGITHEELAAIVKKSRTHITNTLRLLNLSDYAQEALVEGKITTGHAKVLAGLDPKEQREIVDAIVKERLTVRDVERLRMKRRSKLDLDPLTKRLKAIGFETKKSGNRVVIEFTNSNDVDKFLQILERIDTL